MREAHPMEIAPVAGIRIVAQPKAKPVDPELSALFDIEAPVRPDDDTYTASRKKAAGAEESDEDSEQLDEAFEEDFSAEAAVARRADGPEDGPQRQINFFA